MRNITIVMLLFCFNSAYAVGLYTTKYTYGAGNIVSIENPRGKITHYKYQAFGDPADKKLIEIQQPNNVTTNIKRDIFGNILSVNRGTLKRTYQYDVHKYLISESNPETGTTKYTRNLLGKVTEKNIGGVEPITYIYDEMDRVIEIDYPSPGSIQITNKYDSDGRLVQVACSNGYVWQYVYNANNKRISACLILPDQSSKMFFFFYNDLDQLEHIRYPDSTKIYFQPDALGMATKASPYITQIDYFPNGKIKSYKNAAGITTVFTLDDRQLRNSMLVTGNNGNIVNRQFFYDSDKNVSSMIDKLNPSNNEAFTYNDLDWLETASGSWGNENINYDEYGNITAKNIGEQSLHYSYDYNTNRLTSISGAKSLNYRYDNFGDIINDSANNYVYGSSSELLSVSPSKGYQEKFDYDGNENRVFINGKKRILEYHLDNQRLYKENLDDNTSTDYVYLGGNPVVKLQHNSVAKATLNDAEYHYNDLLGSPIAATDYAGKVLWQQDYMPYGKEINDIKSRDDSHTSYTGKDYDDNDGLSYYGARYYNPLIGRFMSVDPAGFSEKVPMSFNKYAYANDNPYRFVDRDGRFFDGVEQVLGGIIGGIAGYHDTGTLKGTLVGVGVGVLASCASVLASEAAAEFAVSRGVGEYGVSVIKNAVKVPIETSGFAAIHKINTGTAKWGDAVLEGASGFIGKGVLTMGFATAGMLRTLNSTAASLVIAGNSYLIGKTFELAVNSQLSEHEAKKTRKDSISVISHDDSNNEGGHNEANDSSRNDRDYS